MKRRSILAAALIALALLPGIALAGRGGRYNNMPAMSPYGPVFNPTMTPEWRQAGGNPYAYQMLMEQKMMLQQQKQIQAYQKQMNAYLKANPQVKKQLEEQQKQAQKSIQAPVAKKKKATRKATTARASESDGAKTRDTKVVAGAPPKPSLSVIRAGKK